MKNVMEAIEMGVRLQRAIDPEMQRTQFMEAARFAEGVAK